jgi:hypothetical protein
MIFNVGSAGVFQYNYNNFEMLKMYPNNGTNLLGSGSNNFILNTGNCGIITKSMYSSPNYSNTYNINYYCYPSIFRSSSGTYNKNFTIDYYYVEAGNKIK